MNKCKHDEIMKQLKYVNMSGTEGKTIKKFNADDTEICITFTTGEYFYAEIEEEYGNYQLFQKQMDYGTAYRFGLISEEEWKAVIKERDIKSKKVKNKKEYNQYLKLKNKFEK